MAFIEVDEPAMLDSTGQEIVDKLDAVKTAVTGLGTTLATDKANRDASNITNASAWRGAIGVGYDVINITTDSYGQAKIGPSSRRAIVSMRVLADRRFATASGYITDEGTTIYVRITDQTGAAVTNTSFSLIVGFISL